MGWGASKGWCFICLGRRILYSLNAFPYDCPEEHVSWFRCLPFYFPSLLAWLRFLWAADGWTQLQLIATPYFRFHRRYSMQMNSPMVTEDYCSAILREQITPWTFYVRGTYQIFHFPSWNFVRMDNRFHQILVKRWWYFSLFRLKRNVIKQMKAQNNHEKPCLSCSYWWWTDGKFPISNHSPALFTDLSLLVLLFSFLEGVIATSDTPISDTASSRGCFRLSGRVKIERHPPVSRKQTGRLTTHSISVRSLFLVACTRLYILNYQTLSLEKRTTTFFISGL